MSDADDWLRKSFDENHRAQAEAADLRAAIAAVRGTARSWDNLVTAVVAPGGALVSLELQEHALQLGARRLQSLITETVHRANTDAAAKLAAAVRPIIGDHYDEAVKAAEAQVPDAPERSSDVPPPGQQFGASAEPQLGQQPTSRPRPTRPVRSDDDEDVSQQEALRWE